MKQKNIIKAMKRNIERFPENFCFQLTEEEYSSLRFQIGILNPAEASHNESLRFQTGTSKTETRGGRQYLPYVFSEQGIAMLSGVLRNETAIRTSIAIMNDFIEMKNFITNNARVFERLNQHELKFLEYDDNFAKLFDMFKKEGLSQKLFYDGQIFDAYSLLIEIINTAEKEIMVVDNYIDNTLLDILSKKKKNVEVLLIGKNSLKISKTDIRKFNEQYPKLELITNNKFHDRFIIIDNKVVYHVGASLKDLGKKCFGINKIENKEFLNKINDIMNHKEE